MDPKGKVNAWPDFIHTCDDKHVIILRVYM